MNLRRTPKIHRVMAEAVRLAKLGHYVGPLKPNTKHPGSRLGKGWPSKPGFTDADSRLVISRVQ